MTQRGSSAKPKLHPFTNVSKDFEEALRVSCTWWVMCSERHPAFSQTQQKNWMDFCHGVVRGERLEVLFDRYLEESPSEEAFFTGYFEPTLYGSLVMSEQYSVPLFALPEGEKTFSRKEIREGALLEKSLILVYVSCPVDAFFLEIQGSGRVILENGDVLRLGYAGQNGYPYQAIGKFVKEDPDFHGDMDFHALKAFLKADLKRAESYMDRNESYVFFKEILKGSPKSAGPIGTQGVSLTPRHSLACDPIYYPFGLPVLATVSGVFKEMTLTQDTGGAIKGPLRFDYFTGYGAQAENLAGSLKHSGRVSIFFPKK